MAVMSFRLCRYSTMRLLCVGSTRAKQRAVRQACRWRWGGSSSNSRPVSPRPKGDAAPSAHSCSVMMPTRRQMDRAVPLLSPGGGGWYLNELCMFTSFICNLLYARQVNEHDKVINQEPWLIGRLAFENWWKCDVRRRSQNVLVWVSIQLIEPSCSNNVNYKYFFTSTKFIESCLKGEVHIPNLVHILYAV